MSSFLLSFNSYAQQINESPYQTNLVKDGIWITTGIGLNVLGLSLIKNKDPLTLDELNALSKDDIWGVGPLGSRL